MERLTRRGKKNRDWVLINKICSKATGAFCPNASSCDQVGDRTCPFLEVVDRLCEYEDTNLEPSEILALKAEVERLKDTNKALESDNYNLDMNLTRLSEELDRLKAGQGNEALNADNICNALEEYRLSKTVSHFLHSGDCKHFRDGIEAAILLIREIVEEREKNMKKELKERENEIGGSGQ